MSRGAGIGAQQRLGLLPIPGNPGGDRKTVLGITDGRLKRAIEPVASVGFENRAPRLDSTRDRDGVDGPRVDCALIEQHRRPQCGGAAARAVISPGGRPGLAHQAEAVSADAAHLRLEHAEHRGRRDRRVGRVATRLQHSHRAQ